MFQSRTGALAFVAMTLIGAVAMVGSEDEAGTIETAKAEFARQQQAASKQAEDLAKPVENPEPLIVEVAGPPPVLESEAPASFGFDPKGLDPKPMIPEPLIKPEAEPTSSAAAAGTGAIQTAPAPQTIIR